MKWLLALFLFACTPAPEKFPNQDAAANYVWVLYEHPGVIPDIVWIDGSDLNCHFIEQDNFDGWKMNNLCYSGEGCVPGSNEVILAHPVDYTYSNAAKSLPHEFNHCRLLDETGNSDPDHKDASWLPGGLVDQARVLLVFAGL
jgi:hypothetical protein